MTDQATATPTDTAQAAPQEQTILPMTPEQMEQVKNQLIELLIKSYHTFIQSISQLPVNQSAVTRSFGYFDDGFLWFKEAIVSMPTQNLRIIPSPQPEAASPETAPQETQAAPEEAAQAAQEEVAPIVA
jgi:hypothetical protein